jgi:hypothetical protein
MVSSIATYRRIYYLSVRIYMITMLGAIIKSNKFCEIFSESAFQGKYTNTIFMFADLLFYKLLKIKF